jgi:carbamoyltransferase
MYTLGINAVFHDSSACILKDGKLLAAVEDERFTHIKHGKRPIPFSTYELPYHAINYCLAVAGIHLNDVNHFAYSFDPYLLLGEHANEASITLPLQPSKAPKSEEWNAPWDPLFLSYIVNAPLHLTGGYPHHLQKNFKGATISNDQWHFVDHHISHAASVYYPSPYIDAAVITLDGRGEIATTTYNVGTGNELYRIGQVNMPHSLGLLYEKVTSYLGFLQSSDEYKVMALASYGKPVFVKEFREMIKVRKNGQYTTTNERLEERFGPARLRHEEFTAHHFDIAHSLQLVLEETALSLCDWLYTETKQENLCMAGGVALNCVMNARIRDKSSFKNIWIQPAAGDSGTALGAAIWVDQQQRKSISKFTEMTHAYWGPVYTTMKKLKSS